MKNIVFIAPPAAGKGTQSKLLCKKYGIPHISMGELFREVASSHTNEGNEILEKMKKGILIDEETTIALLKNRLSREDCASGYILDGFPRNKKQAELYDELLSHFHKKVELVLVLDLPYAEASKRITGRLSCPKCGHVFHEEIESLMPRTAGICDICSEPLVKRSDDNEETFKVRFETYEKETKPLIQYYEARNLVHRIDSSKDASHIFADICETLEEGTL